MWRGPIGLLRLAGHLEGTTLLLLVFIAVPLKHIGGEPLAVSIMGPIHGLSFVMYLMMCMNVLSGGGWTRNETMRILAASAIPFGTFLNDRYLAAKQAGQ